MNHGFKLRYDQMRQGDPTGQETDPLAGDGQYPGAGSTRNVCFVWPDGRRTFLNYAYLLVCAYESLDDRNRISLGFSSHDVVLHGYGLDRLFMALLDHLPRIITVVEPRYALTGKDDRPVVVDIVLTTRAGS